MHDRHVLIMHGAEHLLGELHIPLVGFQNLLGVVAQVTQLEKRDHPRGEQQPDDTQESNGYSSSNSRHTRLTVKIVPNRPYRQGSPPTRTYPERCNKYNARQGQKQTCLNLTELQAVFRKTVQGVTNAESGRLHRNSFLQKRPDGTASPAAARPNYRPFSQNTMRPGGKAASGRNAETKFTRTFA